MVQAISMVQEKGVNHGDQYGDGVAWIRGPMLGKGGFGHVYMATPRNPKSQYSFLPSEMAVKSAVVSVSDTLRKEKEIMSSLKGCPYIIQCFGEETTIGDDGMMVYNLLLEYASGGTLADRIKKSGSCGLSELEVKMHTRSILRGLNHIHDRGYVHCDLKPDNILLVPNRGKGRNISEFRAKIGDFGLAKKEKQSNKKKRLMESPCYWRGTPMYLSPEAVIDYVQEAPCDVWALGCSVLEMLTGRRPWEGQPDEILRRIGAGNEFPKIREGISEEAKHFLMCCFDRKPMRRLACELLLDHPFVDGLGNNDDDDEDEELEDSESVVVVSESDLDNELVSCDSDDWLSSCSSSNNLEVEGFVLDESNGRSSQGILQRGLHYSVAFAIAAAGI